MSHPSHHTGHHTLYPPASFGVRNAAPTAQWKHNNSSSAAVAVTVAVMAILRKGNGREWDGGQLQSSVPAWCVQQKCGISARSEVRAGLREGGGSYVFREFKAHTGRPQHQNKQESGKDERRAPDT